MKSLADKLAEKKALQDQMVKVDDKIDEIVGETKVKINKRTATKKA